MYVILNLTMENNSEPQSEEQIDNCINDACTCDSEGCTEVFRCCLFWPLNYCIEGIWNYCRTVSYDERI